MTNIYEHFSKKYDEIIKHYKAKRFYGNDLPEEFGDIAYRYVLMFTHELFEYLKEKKVNVISYSVRRKTKQSFSNKCYKKLFLTALSVEDKTKKLDMHPLSLSSSYLDIIHNVVKDFYAARIVVDNLEKLNPEKTKFWHEPIVLKIGKKRCTMFSPNIEQNSQYKPSTQHSVEFLYDIKNQDDSGYFGLHFDSSIHSLSDNTEMSAKLNKTKFELQFKTPLAAAWGEMTHDKVYKPNFPTSKLVKYRNSEISSVLRTFEDVTIPRLLDIDAQPVKNKPELLDDWEKIVYSSIPKNSILANTIKYSELMKFHDKFKNISGAEIAKTINDNAHRICNNVTDLENIAKRLLDRNKRISNILSIDKALIKHIRPKFTERSKVYKKYLHGKYHEICGIEVPYIDFYRISNNALFTLEPNCYSLEKYISGKFLSELEAIEYERRESEPFVVNGSIVRISSAMSKNSSIQCVQGQLASYYDQVVTNQSMGKTFKAKNYKNLWQIVHGDNELLPLDDGRNFLVNSLGAAVLVETNNNGKRSVILCRRTKLQNVTKNEISAGFSWAVTAPWYDYKNNFKEFIWQQAMRVSVNELGLNIAGLKRNFHLKYFAREIDRGGKPQVFGKVRLVGIEPREIIKEAYKVAPLNMAYTKFYILTEDDYDKFIEFLNGEKSTDLSSEAATMILSWYEDIKTKRSARKKCVSK